MAKKTKKEKISLKVEKRQVFGRKVKKLRSKGILPANIYGNKVKSLAVQVPLKNFLPVYQKVGETGIVELKVDGENKIRPTLIHNVQFDPVSDQPLHVDFHQVSLEEKITANIPVEIVGRSPAVEQKIGVLIQPLTEVEVEALPTDLPGQFTVDISGLKEVDQAITVGDLKPPAGVKILTSPGQILVKIEPPAKEEVAPPPTEEAPTEEVPEEEKAEAKAPPKEEKPAEVSRQA
ncbi:MAG: 50S ribosomal protein L25 [Microgenomates group bacterium]